MVPVVHGGRGQDRFTLTQGALVAVTAGQARGLPAASAMSVTAWWTRRNVRPVAMWSSTNNQLLPRYPSALVRAWRDWPAARTGT